MSSELKDHELYMESESDSTESDNDSIEDVLFPLLDEIESSTDKNNFLKKDILYIAKGIYNSSMSARDRALRCSRKMNSTCGYSNDYDYDYDCIISYLTYEELEKFPNDYLTSFQIFNVLYSVSNDDINIKDYVYIIEPDYCDVYHLYNR